MSKELKTIKMPSLVDFVLENCDKNLFYTQEVVRTLQAYEKDLCIYLRVDYEKNSHLLNKEWILDSFRDRCQELIEDCRC